MILSTILFPKAMKAIKLAITSSEYPRSSPDLNSLLTFKTIRKS